MWLDAVPLGCVLGLCPVLRPEGATYDRRARVAWTRRMARPFVSPLVLRAREGGGVARYASVLLYSYPMTITVCVVLLGLALGALEDHCGRIPCVSPSPVSSLS